MKTKFLVLHETLVYDSHIFGAGTIFCVARDDKGQGGWQAEVANHYEGAVIPRLVTDLKAENALVFVPGTSAHEYENENPNAAWAAALEQSWYESDDEVTGGCDLEEWIEAYA